MRTPFPVQLERVTVLEITPDPVTVLLQANVPETVFTVTLLAIVLSSTEAAAE